MSFFSIAKGFHKLTSHPPPELTQKEQDRLRAITIYEKTKDVSLVCRTYGISRATLYRWLRRYDPKDLNSLRIKSLAVNCWRATPGSGLTSSVSTCTRSPGSDTAQSTGLRIA